MPRIFDIVVLLFLLPIVLPVLLIIAILTYFSVGTPIFFRQARGGIDNSQFFLLKFRTMTNERDSDGALLADDKRLTRIGKFCRSYSLDELPSFWNLWGGDIRLVGPRPLIADYLPLYTPEQARRHIVSPGITGWAQVNGRNGLSWEEKFDLDLWYIDNRSPWLDLKILWLTLHRVAARDGISADDIVTMPRFEGSRISHDPDKEQ